MVTINQFNNLLKFIAILSHSKYIMDLSPDYIIEKYARLVGNPELISDEETKGTAHQVLIRDLIAPYHEKWKTSEVKFKRNSIIKDIL